MPKLTPQEAQVKYAKNLKNASADITAGVKRVTVAPGVQAAAKSDKMRQGILEALDSGKWKKRVASVSLQDWQSQMLNKGVQRISAGVDGAAQKSVDFFAQLFPFQDQLQGQIKSMPDLTLDDNINRMTTFIRGMSGFKRS
jgi:hypothetical protein